MQTIKKLLTPFAVIMVLATAFWAPALWGGKSLIHGDSILHSLSLWEFHARNADNFGNLLWSKEVFGGHPLFAEGQGEFAYPPHMLLARAMDPIYANNFAHWLGMLLGGLAIFGLNRTVGNSHWASGFATLATLFASYWLHAQQNMTYGAAVTLLPWVLWAGEYWIQRVSWRSAILLGVATALAVLVGYPHLLHGAAIYVAASLLPNLIEKKYRVELFNNFSAVWKTGLLAVLICLGLAAVQLLPLLELAGYSNRSSGTPIILSNIPLSTYLRGLLYNLPTDAPEFFTIIGSPLICLLFSAFVFFKTPVRIKGHVFAALLLFNLGIGDTSPILRVLYDHKLVPGMHYFRSMVPYLIVAVVGISLVAASSVDRLAVAMEGVRKSGKENIFNSPWRNGAATLIFLLFWFFMLRIAGIDIPIGAKHAAIVVLGVSGIVLLTRTNQAKNIPVFLFLVLTIESATMKLQEFHFGGMDVLEKPASVKIVETDDPLKNYKYYDSSAAFLYALGNPHGDNLDQEAKNMLSHLCGLSNLRWNIPSMMGALALPLRERSFLEPVFVDEINAKAVNRAGLRLIDLLSVKYIGFDSPGYAPGFRLIFQDSATNTWLIENTAAKPRFQTYTNYFFAKSTQEALDALQSTATPLLALEIPGFMKHKMLEPIAYPNMGNEPRIEFTLVEDRSTHYQLQIHAQQPGWIFLADANYPGWRAHIDGLETPVFTAQIMGKAVFIPAGEHLLTLAFDSDSFHTGLMLTLFSLLAMLPISIFAFLRDRKTNHAIM